MKKLIFSLFLFLSFSSLAYAQWTTGTDISNTNTGKVNIGTTTSTQAKLLVYTTGNYAGIFRGSTGGAVGVGSLSGVPFLQAATNEAATAPAILSLNPAGGNVGIGTTSPDVTLAVNGVIKTILGTNFQSQNVVSIIPLGYSGITGANNWAIRGVYQYGNGVGNNANGGDLDIIKSLNGNTVLGTKSDGTALGNVLIGQTTQYNSAYLLDVNGSMRAKAITVNTTGADFVFEPSYKLNTLAELQDYIIRNHHLPEIPSAKEMQTKGIDLGQNQVKLLQKVEELTLYLIDKDKQVNAEIEISNEQQKQIEEQTATNIRLSEQLKVQTQKIYSQEKRLKKLEQQLKLLINKEKK